MSEQLWYRAKLRVRRPGSPGCPDRVIEVEASISIQVPAEWPNREDRRIAATAAAEKAFRALGLGTVMDLEEARTGIEVWPI